MKELKVFLVIILSASFLWGVVVFFDSVAKAEAAERAISEAPVPMPTEWCVSVCQEDIFKDLHSKPTTWGAGSSSLSGMGQNDTFSTVVAHCRSVYNGGCIKIKTWSGQDYLHSTGGRRAMAGKINQ